MSRMVELYLHSPICLHGIELNYIIRYRDFTFTSLFSFTFRFRPFISRNTKEVKEIRNQNSSVGIVTRVRAGLSRNPDMIAGKGK
jgi:hypothetical protein